MLLQKQQEFLQEQQKLQERHRLEKERMEKERLEQLKNKTKNEESRLSQSKIVKLVFCLNTPFKMGTYQVLFALSTWYSVTHS